ncbi:hypothetical protein AB0933_32295 [Streptomyces venezuelae]|uniref:hypothetical protein n=1 Tax=Streptomyces venezuelae TaxID=54571 RepID=UPI0034548FEA
MASDTAPAVPPPPNQPPAQPATTPTPESTPTPAPNAGQSFLTSLMTPIEPARPTGSFDLQPTNTADPNLASTTPAGVTSADYHDAETAAAKDATGEKRKAQGSVWKALWLAAAQRWAKGGGTANKRLDVAKARAQANQLKENRTTSTTSKSDGFSPRSGGSGGGASGGGSKGADKTNKGATGPGKTPQNNKAAHPSGPAGRGGGGQGGAGRGPAGSGGSGRGTGPSGRDRGAGTSGGGKPGGGGNSAGAGGAKDTGPKKPQGAGGTGNGAKGAERNSGTGAKGSGAGGSGTGRSGTGGSSGAGSGSGKTRSGKDGATKGGGTSGGSGKQGSDGKKGKDGPAGKPSGGKDGGTGKGGTGKDKPTDLTKHPKGSGGSAPARGAHERSPLQKSRETGHGDGSKARRVADHVRAYKDGVKDGWGDEKSKNAREHDRLDKAHDKHRRDNGKPAAPDTRGRPDPQKKPDQATSKPETPDKPKPKGTVGDREPDRPCPIAAEDEEPMEDPFMSKPTPIQAKGIDANSILLGGGLLRESIGRSELRTFKQYEGRLEARLGGLAKVADATKSLAAQARQQAADCQQLAEEAKDVKGGEKLVVELNKLAEQAKAQADEADEIHKKAVKAHDFGKAVLSNVITRYAPLYQAVVDSDEPKPAELKFYADRGVHPSDAALAA